MNTHTPLKQEIMSGKTIAGAMVFEFFRLVCLPS